MSQLNRQDIQIIPAACRLTNVLRSKIYFYHRQFLWIENESSLE